MSSLEKKIEDLRRLVKGLGSVVVAYSGGVDSTFLLTVCRDVLANRVLAVTGLSETYPRQEAMEAARMARALGVRHLTVCTRELHDPHFKKNPVNRCYHCKKELFRRLSRLAVRHKFRRVVDGSNVDDFSDYRPGAEAKKEYRIVSPLQEAGLTKKEIRIASRRLGLSTWSKPALACLASRIPYGERITSRRLKRIERAEAAVRRAFDIRGNLRVRDYGAQARVEVDKKEIKCLVPGELERLLRPLGYEGIHIDPRGYRTGSMNERLLNVMKVKKVAEDCLKSNFQ